MKGHFRSFLAALTAIAMTTLLGASFVGSTQAVQWLGGRAIIAHTIDA